MHYFFFFFPVCNKSASLKLLICVVYVKLKFKTKKTTKSVCKPISESTFKPKADRMVFSFVAMKWNFLCETTKEKYQINLSCGYVLFS